MAMNALARFGLLPMALYLASAASVVVVTGCAEQKPEVRLATLNELKALVPKELLNVPPEDKAAKARYEKLIALAKKIKPEDANRVTANWSALWQISKGGKTNVKVTEAEQIALVKRLWKTNPHLLSDLEAVLASGPLAVPSGLEMEDADSSRAQIDLTRMLAFSSESYVAASDFGMATRLVLLLYRLVDAMRSGSGSIFPYLATNIVMGISTSTTDLYAQSKFPAKDCSVILRSLQPAPKEDQNLVAAIKGEFLEYTLPDLASNKPKLTGAGSYDALETVKKAARKTQFAISNASVPLSKLDRTSYNELEQDANDVLRHIYQSNYKGPYKSMDLVTAIGNTLDAASPAKPPTPNTEDVRSALNRIHNSLGRLVVGQYTWDILPTLSCGWRAERDLTRILLASRVYRASHGGKLPPTVAGFVPILGAWPTNPFDGQPFTYLPKQEKVYGVGNDLTDHGGDLGNGIVSGKDAGISLQLTR